MKNSYLAPCILSFFLMSFISCTNTQTKTIENVQAKVSSEEMNTRTNFETQPAATKSMYDVYIEAYEFGYASSAFNFTQGDTITFHLKTRDVGHSFTVRELGIDVRASPAKDGIQTVTISKKGLFTAHCRVECGFGHSKMSATVVVQ